MNLPRRNEKGADNEEFWKTVDRDAELVRQIAARQPPAAAQTPERGSQDRPQPPANR